MEEVFRFYLHSKTILFHKGLSLKQSTVDDPKSGYGLFVSPSKFSNEELDNETVQLLRIPKRCTFNINTLLTILGDENEFSSLEQFQRTGDKIKTTLREIMTYPKFSRFLTETNLLILYFMIFETIHDSYEIPGSIEYYLKNVLMSIEVESAVDSIENLAKDYGHYPQIFGLQEISGLFKDLFQEYLDASVIKHLYSAIISRCLEIPEKSDTGDYEFSVHSTLVPILDFANHENSQKNAYFDVDPSSNDVLLLLNTDTIRGKSSKPREVFISYMPTEDLLPMLNTYGFIPDFKESPQFWTISFDRGFLRDYIGLDLNADLRLFYKWLRINPVISLVKYEHDDQIRWFINDTTKELSSLLLPFIPPLDKAKNARWVYDSACHLTFTKMHCLVNPETNEHATLVAENYHSLIEEVELNGDDFIDLPPLAWSLHYKDAESGCLRQRHTDCEEATSILQHEQEQDTTKTKLRFVSFFRDFLKYRKARIAMPSSNSCIARLLFEQEKEIINDLAAAIDNKSTIFFSDLKTALSAEPNKFPPLRFHNEHTESNKNKDELVPYFKDPSSYNPDRFTDFFQDEMNQYAAFFRDG
ncbi:hypothetical protein SEUBUCD646_0O02760 [Saccharomyces eubayanus]|uniref:SET domain-containing protein n=1 Tax=Saccharomyces eubayanus TaxID=1080349 RepID=A0ABN8VIG1_SACEU|nr:hypothetical protein SEUBUCD650_0O02750 [Saccharomyces eubayanus]CAI1762888.1 hypothetical protein SEUBUCD646_0O02760 [Saccharomyces eubayanus]